MLTFAVSSSAHAGACNIEIAAAAFYRQLVFEPLRRVERYYSNSEAARVMSKHLGQSVGLSTTPWQPAP